MNTAKFLIGVVALIAIYFVFFTSDVPGEVEFRGQTLGPKQQIKNNSLKNFDIYRYSARANHRVLVVVMAKDESATAQELLEVYVKIFEAQEFSFRKKDNWHLGIKGDEVIYMTLAPKIDSAVAYIEKAPEKIPSGFRSVSDIYVEIENFSFD